ncbi:hypothetical protein [uncultured Gelidibacter sp.]|uniref:hypothetical protein n=1 Tax=uncultured Gelidibacter sp. TaxID=259318 RepID=UPI0026282655|nr:hypothetical protein [uncultured Gelidibacter sp.]
MQKIFYLLSLCVLLTACDDGDIIEVELDFDKQLAMCELNPEVYFLYETKTDPSESLSLIFPKNSATRLIFNPETNNYTSSFEINGSTTKFNYRTYDGKPENLICNLLPDANTHILKDYAATSGSVTTLTTFIDDDGDGIPSAIEDKNLDGDNNPATNPTDSDGDGIPDYLDADDDNDNVLTKNEGHNYTEADGLSKAQDTDGDGIPDYLDTDDDGDGVLTRFEDENLNGNPMDDRDESSPTPTVARYLDKVAKDVFEYKQFNKNTYQRIITVKFQVKNVNLDIISLTDIDFGTYTQTFTIESK